MHWNSEGLEMLEVAISFNMIRCSKSYSSALPASIFRQNGN